MRARRDCLSGYSRERLPREWRQRERERSAPNSGEATAKRASKAAPRERGLFFGNMGMRVWRTNFSHNVGRIQWGMGVTAIGRQRVSTNNAQTSVGAGTVVKFAAASRPSVVMVIVVIVVILPAGFGGGSRGGALDGGCTYKRVGAENNAAADRLTGRGMFRQRGVFD